jgi:hypothetical protein
VTIWTDTGTQTVAAAPPYLIERLRNAGFGITVIYDSVAAWQKARAGEEPLRRSPSISIRKPRLLIRIAIINLTEREAAAPGYSDGFGDREDILMRDGLGWRTWTFFSRTARKLRSMLRRRALHARGY